MSPGAGRLTTTGGGCGMAALGHGGRDRCGARVSTVHSGRRLMCRSSDSEAVSGSGSDLVGVAGAVSAGCRLGLATVSTHGGEDTVAASALSASIDSVQTGLGESRHCMAALDSRT